MRIRVTKGTFDADRKHLSVNGLGKFPEGYAVDFPADEEEAAKRWVRAGFAEPWDGPVGVTSNEQAAQSVEDIDAEIRRLEELKAAKAERQEVGEASRDVYRGDEHPLARYDLTEKQRVALERAGFDQPGKIDDAADAELLDVDGIGEAALAKLRGKG